jgi:acetolactate synthase-1/2/3 large subunit
MGYAIPAALGVAIALPNEQVWAICGDGGFQMTSQELATIRQEKLRNIRVAVINNGHLGMVRQWQQLFEQRRYSETPLSSPDFVALAGAYGWHALRVSKSSQLNDALKESWDHDGAVLIEFVVQQEANVFPIVPQGESISTMLTAEPTESGTRPDAPAHPPAATATTAQSGATRNTTAGAPALATEWEKWK